MPAASTRFLPKPESKLPRRREDEIKSIRKSHKNTAALRLYREYLGEFGSEKAHRLLHTKYSRKDYV